MLYEFTVTDMLALPFTYIWDAALDAAHDQEMFELQMDGEEAKLWPGNRLVLVGLGVTPECLTYSFEVQEVPRA